MFNNKFKKYKKVYFIDCEHVGFELPFPIDKNAYYYYFCNNNAKIDFNSVNTLMNHRNIGLYTHTASKQKKNSLDFCIVVELTKMVLKYKENKEYYIVSKDKGYGDAINILKGDYSINIDCIPNVSISQILTDYQKEPLLIKRLEKFIDLDMLVYIRNENELCQLLGQLNYDKLILLRHEEIRNDILNLKWDIFNREFQFLINGKQINKLKEYKKALKCFENYSNNKRLYPSRKLKEKAEKLSISDYVVEAYQSKMDLLDCLKNHLGNEEGIKVFNEFVNVN